MAMFWGMRLPGNGMSWKEFGQGLKDEVTRDNVTDLAATVTYYGVLALFPSCCSWSRWRASMITPAQAESLVAELARWRPGEVTRLVGERIQPARASSRT